jgi:hypothetical protein
MVAFNDLLEKTIFFFENGHLTIIGFWHCKNTLQKIFLWDLITHLWFILVRILKIPICPMGHLFWEHSPLQRILHFWNRFIRDKIIYLPSSASPNSGCNPILIRHRLILGWNSYMIQQHKRPLETFPKRGICPRGALILRMPPLQGHYSTLLKQIY